MALICPRCTADLKPITYRNITIDKCPQCNGVWLDKGEEPFVVEILKQEEQSHCGNCLHYLGSKRKCSLLNIFVNRDFSCSHFSRITQT